MSRCRFVSLVALWGALVLLAGFATPASAAVSVAPDGERPPLVNVKEPRVTGEARYGRTLTAHRGRWRPGPAAVRYQWLREGRPIKGATQRRYDVRPADVGARLSLEVRVRAPGRSWTTERVRAGRAAHRVPLRRTVKYSVRVKGATGVDLRRFKRLTQQTYDDARGWRGRGVRFQRVATGGAFTLWISAPHLVPSFSSGCSAEWSCRVGRNVIINATRWKHASPAWNAAKLSLRGYRHMVLNHETGHWLGYGHASCPGAGALAPVMMQQSKGTGGCRFNPWPTQGELDR